MQQFVWVAVIAGAFILFWLPVIAAAIRGTDQTWIVVLLTVLTPLNGVTWFAAWYAVFALPRRQATPPLPAAPPRTAALAPWDDPKTFYGVLADPALSGRPAGTGAGVSAWS